MSKYEIILYWSEPDHAFIAEVPELPGCAADGPTRQEAIANAEVIIQQWIETAKELAVPFRNPRADSSSPEYSCHGITGSTMPALTNFN